MIYHAKDSQYTPPALLLEDETPDAVASAMIERGQKEPFYIFNMDETCRRVQHFKEIMPRVKIFYAMKSNDTEIMLKLAVALGVGFSCASPGEIYKMRQLNVNPRSIYYSMPCKTPSEMQYACKAGVIHTSFDSSYQLKKLQQYWPNARLLIRVRIRTTGKELEAKNNSPKEKFGCEFENSSNLLDEAAGLGLKVVGVSFQVTDDGSLEESYSAGLQQARKLFEHEAGSGRRMNVVDIGGGYHSIDGIAHVINSKVDELFPEREVQVIATPGRYISENAFTMYCNIIGVRRVVFDSPPINMIYLNNGIYGTMRVSEDWHKIRKFTTSSNECLNEEDTIMWGGSCDSVDRLFPSHKLRLPPCSAGHWLSIDNHGAYTFSYHTEFSSLPIPIIRPVISKNLWNVIKHSSVFRTSDFVPSVDISVPLASTLPPVLLPQDNIEHPDIPTLIV